MQHFFCILEPYIIALISSCKLMVDWVNGQTGARVQSRVAQERRLEHGTVRIRYRRLVEQNVTEIWQNTKVVTKGRVQVILKFFFQILFLKFVNRRYLCTLCFCTTAFSLTICFYSRWWIQWLEHLGSMFCHMRYRSTHSEPELYQSGTRLWRGRLCGGDLRHNDLWAWAVSR